MNKLHRIELYGTVCGSFQNAFPLPDCACNSAYRYYEAQEFNNSLDVGWPLKEHQAVVMATQPAIEW